MVLYAIKIQSTYFFHKQISKQHNQCLQLIHRILKYQPPKLDEQSFKRFNQQN